MSKGILMHSCESCGLVHTEDERDLLMRVGSTEFCSKCSGNFEIKWDGKHRFYATEAVSKGKPEKSIDFDAYLARESFTWQDLVIFATDEYLGVMLKEMVFDGDLPKISREDLFELENYIKEKAREVVHND